MKLLEQILMHPWLDQPWVSRAGWTLVHFLWQGTVIALLFAAVRYTAGRALSAQARYLLGCGTLATMTATPLVTFLVLGNAGSHALAQPIWRIAPASAWQQALPWLVLAWAGGVAVSSARLIAGLRVTARLRTMEVAAAPDEWRVTLHRMMARVRVTRTVRLLASRLVAAPTVVGWLRPVILMPASALTGMQPAQLEALLAHELAHIRRHDYLVNILQNAAEAVLFYHPAVWWVSEQIRNEREMCCDDIAVEASGDILMYTTALADLAARRPERGEMALAANGGSLLSRIRRLAGKPERAADNLPGSGAAWAVGLLWLAGVGAMTLYGSPVKPPVKPIIAVSAHPLAPAWTPAPAMKQEPTLIARAAAKTLLFDPFFDEPQTQPAGSPQQTQPAANIAPEDKVHVTGTVVGGAHEPLKKATVRLEVIESTGQSSAYSETTDETGKFAIDDVAPGSYRLSARKTGFVEGQYGAHAPSATGATLSLKAGATLKDIEVALMPQGTIAGRITDQEGDPVARAPVTVLRSGYSHGRKTIQDTANLRAQTDDTGRFRIGNVPPGRYYLKGDQMNQPPDLEPGVADVATYYPAAAELASAAPIDVAAGTRVEGINIRLRRAHVYSVKGTVLLDGAPVNTLLEKKRLTDDPFQPGSGLTVQNGALAVSYVEPGSYSLSVMPNGSIAPGVPLALGLSGHAEFTVKDSNVEGLLLTLEHGVDVSGAFKLDGGTWQDLFTPPGSPGSMAPPATAQAAAQTKLPFIRLAADNSGRYLPLNRIDADGTFKLKPMAVGRYLLEIASLPPGTYVKSVRYGTLDVTNAPINVIAGGGELEILLSAKAANITGALRGSSGDPQYGRRVTAWPENPNPGTVTGGIVSVYTDQSGAFTFAGLAPGTYYIAAWEEIDAGLAQDAGFLQKFTGQAAKVTVDESAQKSADVKVIPADTVAREAARLPQ